MCTGIRFLDTHGSMYFARNFDWTQGYGQQIMIVPHGFKPNSSFKNYDQTKFATIGVGIMLDDNPAYFDCANEKGLAGGVLNFKGYASYEPEPVDGKTNIGVSEFMFWAVSQFQDLDELEAALQNVAIVSLSSEERYKTNQIHWMFADARRSIVVEYTVNGMEIYHNNVDVLTNQPGYWWHHDNLRNYLHVSNEMPAGAQWTNIKLSPFGVGAGMQGLPGGYGPAERFVRAAYLNANYPTQDSQAQNISRAFHELASVAMIDGAAATAQGDFEKTLYTSCFSAKTLSYFYNTYDDIQLKQASLMDFDLDTESVISFDMQ